MEEIPKHLRNLLHNIISRIGSVSVIHLFVFYFYTVYHDNKNLPYKALPLDYVR